MFFFSLLSSRARLATPAERDGVTLTPPRRITAVIAGGRGITPPTVYSFRPLPLSSTEPLTFSPVVSCRPWVLGH